MFNALNISVLYYLIAAVIGIIGCWRKDWVRGVLAAYLFFVLAGTVLIRKPGVVRYELTPFWSWKDPLHFDQIIANLLLFIPIGILLGKKICWKSIPVATSISLLIELTQLITSRGLFEFDDVIHNTLGAVIGFGICTLLRRVKHDI